MAALKTTPRLLTASLLVGCCAAGFCGLPSRAADAPGGTEAGVIREVAPVRFLGDVPDTGTIFPADQLRRRLEKNLGASCEPERIAEELATRYRFLGYVPLVRAACEDGVLRVEVRESSFRVAVITFDASDLSRIGMAAGAHFQDEKTMYPVPESAPRSVLLGLLETRPGDLYNTERYHADRSALERLGYLVLFISGPPAQNDGITDGAYLIQAMKPIAEDPKTRAKRLNYFGGGGSYGPRTGPAVGLVYQRNDLLRAFDHLTISPTYSTAIGGELTYIAPFVAAGEDPRRLYDWNGSLFSTFQNNRLLEGEEVDERRSGAGVGFGIRPLELPSHQEWKFNFNLRREIVRLEGGPQQVPGANLTLLQLGAVHSWHHTDRPPALTLRTLPTLELSLGIGDDVAYVRPEISMFLHSRRMSGLEYDLHLTAGGLDRPVPEFELFSLGGPVTVRGFQPDTFLGRGLAALQAEIWIPFVAPLEAHSIGAGDPSDPANVPHEPTVARRIKAAVFLDGGSIWQSTEGEHTSIYGAGVGIRFVVPQQPLVIRLDYGWGLGSLGGNAYPYVSIGYVF